ncbi:hypothetical protein F8568_020465 [Actinomadura sp. LD22]|uniref:Uncharacterized protein n=1 Tax=Actinomadura physcomitrii TaxID=2650748 RepID=A0A6I4MKG3_9ACTN|nr:hypothetical protein [Actinomadura physcomitrii]MWA02706.1 hypothetical protein [Actinomadura physcomitrii]
MAQSTEVEGEHVGAKFEFDERALNRLVESKLKEMSREFERLVERLTRQLRGRPVDEIKPVLKREWKRIADGDLKDPQLTTIATAISEGTKVDFNVKM